MRCAAALACMAIIGLSTAGGGLLDVSAATMAGGFQKTNPVAMSEESVKAGRLVYARTCRACHGLQGKGDGVAAPAGARPANLVDSEWKHGGSDAEIFKVIKEGIAPYDAMQPWGRRIGDTDIWHVVNFLRDLAKRARR